MIMTTLRTCGFEEACSDYVLEMGLDIVGVIHCSHYLDRRQFGTFCQCYFVKLDKSHHHCGKVVSIAALNMGIEPSIMACQVVFMPDCETKKHHSYYCEVVTTAALNMVIDLPH